MQLLLRDKDQPVNALYWGDYKIIKNMNTLRAQSA